MKVGDIDDIVAQLRYDVCINGHQAYVLTCGCEFDEVICRLATDVECGNYAYFLMERHCLTQVDANSYKALIARKTRELKQKIFAATENDWFKHKDELYVAYGNQSTKWSIIKAGTYNDVLHTLTQDVCLDGGKAYILTDEKMFECLLSNLAGECASNRFSLWHYNRNLIPSWMRTEFRINMVRARKVLDTRIFLVGEDEIANRAKEIYVVARDVQLGIDTFAKMVDEGEGGLAGAVDCFNDCYNAKRFFNETKDIPNFSNDEALKKAIANPICFVGKENSDGYPRMAFISLVLAYLDKSGNNELKKGLFKCAMKEKNPRFKLTKAILYWYYHEYSTFNSALNKLPSLKTCGLSKEYLRENGIEE